MDKARLIKLALPSTEPEAVINFIEVIVKFVGALKTKTVFIPAKEYKDSLFFVKKQYDLKC